MQLGCIVLHGLKIERAKYMGGPRGPKSGPTASAALGQLRIIISRHGLYTLLLLLIDRAIRRNWVMLDSLVEKYRMTQ